MAEYNEKDADSLGNVYILDSFLHDYHELLNVLNNEKIIKQNKSPVLFWNGT